MSGASDGAEGSAEKAAPANWILQHPTYQQMQQLQVEDSEQIYTAFLVYMDLTEVRRWKEVSCVRSPELQVVLLEAREKDGAPAHTVLPLPVHRRLSHRSVRHVLDRGLPMLLCAVASDSTLVYQRMTDGLVTPDPPVGPFEDLGRRQHRKRRQQR
ncbi:tRNA-splicing endonuclease subunit Sen15 [Fundulus heteroclitus]|uniref:tRNA-splicing endonuclease subunit Sen15 n=1 Tax=Fundulus heteroclitus TaxID=8078 RepID=UPI000B367E42|nr:tRNA-splicing endonuclease subunit Sen15 [Fundulus heteroclitus]